MSIVDLRFNREAATFDFTGGCTEIFDVRFLPGVLRPMILNGNQDATGRASSTAGILLLAPAERPVVSGSE